MKQTPGISLSEQLMPLSCTMQGELCTYKVRDQLQPRDQMSFSDLILSIVCRQCYLHLYKYKSVKLFLFFSRTYVPISSALRYFGPQYVEIFPVYYNSTKLITGCIFQGEITNADLESFGIYQLDRTVW